MVPRMFAAAGYLSDPERERIVPVRGQGDRVGRDLRSRVIADRHWNVHLSRRYRVQRNAGGRPVGVVESDDVGVGIPAFQRHHRLLIVVAEDHKAADIPGTAELRRAGEQISAPRRSRSPASLPAASVCV